MLLKDLINHLESVAPSIYQESYDNSGLLTGSPDMEVAGVLISLDAIESVVDEAIDAGCNVIVSHHPIIFGGLKRLNGNNYVERTVIKAIKHDIALYAIHTNLDNMLHSGVNEMICNRLGLENLAILSPKQTRYVSECLVANDRLDSFIHSIGFISTDVTVSEIRYPQFYSRVQILAEKHQLLDIQTVSEEHRAKGFTSVQMSGLSDTTGAGMIGTLPSEVNEIDFLKMVSEKMGAGAVRYTALTGRPVQRVAVCGGAGIFLLKDAIRQKADAYITADVKYHEFFDADRKILLADIGHFESEQFTIELLYQIISDKFSTFAVRKTKISTNPIHYL